MNQREIKFRAWDKDIESMSLNPFTIQEVMGTRMGMELSVGRDLVFMQYTGLKDRNGKDLYEGDIVHIRDGTSENAGQEVWTVEYDNSKASFSVFNQLNSIRYFSDDPECLFRDCPIVEVTEDLVWHPEILGNIYKNVDLISSLKSLTK